MARLEFESVQELLDFDGALSGAVFQSLDLRPSEAEARLEGEDLSGCLFLGCELGAKLSEGAASAGALVFPRLDGLTFRPYRGTLYRTDELLGGYRPGIPESYADTVDGKVYREFLETGRGRPTDPLVTLARRLHDFSIVDALDEVLEGRVVVAVMGGHGLQRNSESYRKVARLSRSLAAEGYLLISGGGPGAMEACHLGAWLAGGRPDELEGALDHLGECGALTYDGPSIDTPEPLRFSSRWLDAAWEARSRFASPEEVLSVGIPTWLYGHEPPTVFAHSHAKLFANSVREEGLLARASGGVIYAPGSAGTIQEIFQDAAQNHYETYGTDPTRPGHASPMVFLDERFWKETKPVFPLLVKLAAGRRYGELLTCTDDEEEAARAIRAFNRS